MCNNLCNYIVWGNCMIYGNCQWEECARGVRWSSGWSSKTVHHARLLEQRMQHGPWFEYNEMDCPLRLCWSMQLWSVHIGGGLRRGVEVWESTLCCWTVSYGIQYGVEWFISISYNLLIFFVLKSKTIIKMKLTLYLMFHYLLYFYCFSNDFLTYSL